MIKAIENGIECHCEQCGCVAGQISFDLPDWFEKAVMWATMVDALCAKCWREKHGH